MFQVKGLQDTKLTQRQPFPEINSLLIAIKLLCRQLPISIETERLVEAIANIYIDFKVLEAERNTASGVYGRARDRIEKYETQIENSIQFQDLAFVRTVIDVIYVVIDEYAFSYVQEACIIDTSIVSHANKVLLESLQPLDVDTHTFSQSLEEAHFYQVNGTPLHDLSTLQFSFEEFTNSLKMSELPARHSHVTAGIVFKLYCVCLCCHVIEASYTVIDS